MFPLQTAYLCQLLPHVNGPTVSEYYGLIRLPTVFGFPTCRFGSAYLYAFCGGHHQCTKAQEPIGSPKFLSFLSTHATLFVDPGRPSGTSPTRFLCVGFWSVNTIAICIILDNGAVSRLQGVRSPLWPTWFPVYASIVSFGEFTY